MKVYITTGTYDFLLKIKTKYVNENIILMQNSEHTILLHETEKKTVFASPRKYEQIAAAGKLQDGIFFIFTYLPISDEGKPVFEYHFKNNLHVIEQRQGFAALRLLRAIRGDNYVAITGWKDENSYKQWKQSLDFQLVHSIDPEHAGVKMGPYDTHAYHTTYFIPQDEGDH